MQKKTEGKTILSLPGKVVADLIRAVSKQEADFRFRASGISMSPTIREGDIITLSPLKNGRAFRGEVVAVLSGPEERLLVHRIIKLEAGGVVTRGDSAVEADGVFPLRDILGIVTRVERQNQPVFWPDRRNNLFFAALYFRFRLFRLSLKRRIKTLLMACHLKNRPSAD